ncbi:HAMP domain-containing histidine kinase [Candidatus Saccharibacteria bacterium]|nr:HAMP domain-containing histidine kinase [Candidatus Saccharibacteria bacterium]
MFRKLRNKLILINLGITTVVILATFTTIYFFATNLAKQRPPETIEKFELMTEDFEKLVNITIQNEKRAAAQDLLVVLILSGIAIECAVACVSYFMAEAAIRPVREAYESQKIFIANASHEIKTPLAAISANLEAADIKDNKWISNVERETEKLTALNTELLTLAKSDLVNEHSSTSEVDIAKLIHRELKQFEPRLNGIDLEVDVISSSGLKIVVSDFTQIFNILMDNAIKYCNKEIDVRLKNAELAISNDGATISKDDLTKVFDRFYQADKSAEGVGLGLSIAKAVAERNGWELTADSGNNKTTFLLKIK